VPVYSFVAPIWEFRSEIELSEETAAPIERALFRGVLPAFDRAAANQRPAAGTSALPPVGARPYVPSTYI